MTELESGRAALKAACKNPRARLHHYLKQGKKWWGAFRRIRQKSWFTPPG